MMSPRGIRARGFTLIELLIVIAIIGILIAAIAVAVTKAKEIAWQTTCGSNIKQVMQSMNTFHEHHHCYPTYNGIFPTAGAGARQSDDTRAVYGSWFVHLLPYTENKWLHDTLREEFSKYGNGGGNVTVPGGTLISAAVGARWVPPPFPNPGEPPTIPNPNYNPNPPPVVNNGNGYTYSPPGSPSTGSPTMTNPNYLNYSLSTRIPGSPAVYGPPGPPINNGPIGLWKRETRAIKFKVLVCPSDQPGDGNSGDGLVYKLHSGGAWGATNYLANWNAITNGNGSLGWQVPPGRRELVEDGPGNTIFLGEAYAWCERKGRTALLAWHTNVQSTNFGGVHNFGLTFGISSITFSGSTASTQAANGVPNPSVNPAISIPFQIQPHVTRSGQGGCVSLTVQSPHASLNVVMGDGSVRKVRESITPAEWLALMLPKDGGATPSLD